MFRGFLVYVILFSLSNAVAEELSELSVFSRCYTHLTQRALPTTHPLRAQVKSGALKATDACLQILDSAKLRANEGTLINDNTESRMVLSTMNGFHRTWFPNDHIMKAIPFLEDFNGQPYIHDETEPGLHVTRTLFTDGVRFSEVVTGDSAMEALRTNGPSTYNAKLQQWNDASNGAMDLVAQLVQTGALVGVRRMVLNSTKQNLTTNSRDGTTVAGQTFGSPGKIRVHAALGGGVIGTPSYLLLNLGRPNMNASDGGMVMNRRWSRTVMSDLLCRELPALRLTDAAPFVQTNVTAKTPPFRKAGTCMSCHSTIDPMAATIRNLSYATSYYVLNMGTAHIRTWPTTQPAESGVVDEDANYFQRPTRGNLFYRSYDGSLISQSVNSLPELGQAIANTNDLYVCTAAKYFQFFTGMKVNLQDIGDPTNQALPAADKAYRDMVINWGLALKSNQSLRSLIQSILNSPVYRSSSMRGN